MAYDDKQVKGVDVVFVEAHTDEDLGRTVQYTQWESNNPYTIAGDKVDYSESRKNHESKPYSWYDYCTEHRIDIVTYYEGYICDRLSFNLVFADDEMCPRGNIITGFKAVDITPWIK